MRNVRRANESLCPEYKHLGVKILNGVNANTFPREFLEIRRAGLPPLHSAIAGIDDKTATGSKGQ
jgi:hypothetical protein